MARPLQETLTPEKALIFRITHRSNVPWMLRNGLHSRRSSFKDPHFVAIGNPDLIEKRRQRRVPIPPGGSLDDYVPFYFTPFSPMLYNITTGYSGITKQNNRDIVILVSSLPSLEEFDVQYVFTDRHAYLETAEFFSDRAELPGVDFELLQQRDFQRDPEDLGKIERYQAEALAHDIVPVSSLHGLACYTEDVKQEIDTEASRAGVELNTIVKPGWFF